MGSLPATAGVTNVLVDPKQPKHVYAATEAGLLSSDDAGETWLPATQPISAGKIVAVALDPTRPERLYVATSDNALYASQDGAATWQKLTALMLDAPT